MEEAINELKSLVTLSAHPAMIASYYDARQDWDSCSDLIATSAPQDSSHFTLSHAIFASSIPFSIKPEPKYEISTDEPTSGSQPPRSLKHPSMSWEEYNQFLRDMIPTIFLMSIRFSDGLKES